MNVKRIVLFVILLAVICIGQQAVAQHTTPSNPGSEFVPLTGVVLCNLTDIRMAISNQNGELVTTLSSVKKVTCQITGKNHGRKKEISLLSTEITNGMLSTREFGLMKLEAHGSGSNPAAAITISVRPEMLQSIRDFLQK
jgi:hypothetical protein